MITLDDFVEEFIPGPHRVICQGVDIEEKARIVRSGIGKRPRDIIGLSCIRPAVVKLYHGAVHWWLCHECFRKAKEGSVYLPFFWACQHRM